MGEGRSGRSWQWALLVGLAVATAAGALAVAVGAEGVRRGLLAGPTFAVQLGEYHLIARTTTRPECLPLTQHECFVSFPTPSYTTPPSYTVWAGRIVRERPTATDQPVTVSSGRTLLQIALRR